MTGLAIELARWIARALHGLAARLDSWSMRQATAGVAAPTVSFETLSERFPGAPAHWLATLAEHMGEEAAALPMEHDGVEMPADAIVPPAPRRAAGTEAETPRKLRRTRPALIFANRSMPPARSASPDIASSRKGRTSLSFAPSGRKPGELSAPARRSMAAKVRLMLIPGGRGRNPVEEAAALPTRHRPEEARYPEGRKSAAPEQRSSPSPSGRAPVRFPLPETHRNRIDQPQTPPISPRSSASLPMMAEQPAPPPVEFAPVAASRYPMVHFAHSAVSWHDAPMPVAAPRSSWATLPPSDATIADAAPSFAAGRDDRYEQMVGRWSA